MTNNISKSEMNIIFPSGMGRQIFTSDLQLVVQKLDTMGYLSPGTITPTVGMEKSVYDINDNGLVDFAEHAITADTATNALNIDGSPACDFVTINEANQRFLRLDNGNYDSFGTPPGIPTPGDILTWDPNGSILGEGAWVQKAPIVKAIPDISDIVIDGTETAAINAAKINELLASLRTSGLLE